MNIRNWRRSVPITAVLIVGGAFAFQFASTHRTESIHFELEETELVITNLAGGRVHLYKSGASLDEASELSFDGGRIWLKPGNYFLKTEAAGITSFYPVPIIGYRGGPDEDGKLIVTIRSLPRDEPPLLLTSSPHFVWIPSGAFLLGERLNKQEPHYVWRGGFFIGSFEVTNAEFKEFIDAGGYNDSANWTPDGRRWKEANQCRASSLLKSGDGEFKRFGQPDQPVTNVSWFEANAFCRWMSRKLGSTTWIFALPNEAEWEKAARGPDGFDYGLCNSVSDNEVALYNWKKNASAEVTVAGWSQTPTGYRPNRYGLYHMSGNVSEWTQSIARAFSRQKPFMDDERNHDEASGARVLKGGSWYTASTAVLSLAYRESFQPSVSAPYLGFRIVVRPLP
jgi:formylglycine-generating enzyme required for sulfatase activity